MRQTPDIYDYDDDEAYWDDEQDEGPPEKEIKKHKDVEKLGMGAFATAYKSKKNPYDVVKGSRATRETDGFRAFYDMLAANEDAQSNPYFPRFRAMSKYTGDDDKQSYIARMEPLENYNTLTDAERKALLDRMFSEHGEDVIKHYWEEENRKFNKYYRNNMDDVETEAHDLEIFAWAVRMAVENDMWGDELRWEIEDEQFKQAVQFLRNAAEKSEFDPDLHRHNLMIRRTSVGPQLVINDPLGGSTSGRDGTEWE